MRLARYLFAWSLSAVCNISSLYSEYVECILYQIPILYVIQKDQCLISDPLHRGVRSRGAECAYAPLVTKFEIVCFCPSWKKAVRWGRWGGLKDTSGDLPTFYIFSLPKIYCYNPYFFKVNWTCHTKSVTDLFVYVYQKSLKGMFKTSFLSTKSPFEFVV